MVFASAAIITGSVLSQVFRKIERPAQLRRDFAADRDAADRLRMRQQFFNRLELDHTELHDTAGPAIVLDLNFDPT